MTAGTNVGTAYLEIIPSARGFAGKLQSQVGGDMVKGGRTAGESYSKGFSGGLKRLVGIGAGFLAVSKVTGFLKDANAEAREAQKVGALTTQVIKSTGGAANVTAAKVGKLATSISNKVGVDDEAIQSGENMLLTFKNIRNEAGKGNDIFDQAAHTTTDLAAAMAAASGGELNFRSASIQMGKALNDPIKGVTALSRVGVQFTDQQKDQIKALVEAGDTMGAQKIILKELKSEFGGAAEAQATAGDKARVSMGNLKETIGTALLPVVDDLSERFTNDVAPAITEFVTGMQDGTGAGGEFADDLKKIFEAGKNVVEFLNDLPGPVKKFAVEGGIALIVLGKMRALFGPAATSVNGFVSGMARAETRMDTVAGASRRLGAGIRNVAGAGGMLLLADGAQKSDSAVGALETTLGGAAAGFAVGGPIGAAVGGLGGLTYSLWQATKHAGDEAKVQIGSWTAYESTLEGVKAKTTAATREMVLQRLEESGLLTATQQLGLSDRQAVSAVMGNVGARTKLAEALRHSRGLTDEQKAALERETGAVGASRKAQLEHNIAIAEGKEALKKARQALQDFMKEPAAKRVSITGVEAATAQLSALSRGLREALGLTKDLNNAGPGGIDVLLTAPLKARGGPVTAGRPYIVGERRPELFVPSTSGTIVPKIPTSGGSAIESEQTSYRAFSRALADSGMVIMPKRNLADLDLLASSL